MTDQTRKSSEHQFELDPFVSEIARWIDLEVADRRPEIRAIDLADRIARICLQLHERGVATMIKPGRVAVWVATAEVAERIGGSSIAANSCFTRTRCTEASLGHQFQMMVRKHTKRRLASILEMTETLFQLCNDGRIKIIGANSNGNYLWGPTFAPASVAPALEDGYTNPKR
jgi:hypothetical protein